MPLVEQKKYKIKSFIAIQHSFDGNTEHIHAHTVEINCSIKTEKDIIDYKLVEGTIQKCIDRYENKYLNELKGFEESATIERLGEVLCYEIDDELKPLGYEMDRFEIGETPLRLYVITDELRD
jgi:6-pyruvoyl tetrahydropterin synthase-like protein